MEYEAFREKLCQLLQEKLQGKGEISVVEVQKNNTGNAENIVIRALDRQIAPTVRLSMCYQSFCDGASVQTIADRLAALVEDDMPSCLEQITVEDYEMVKNGIHMRLINTAQNAGLLLTRPHREFKDFSVVYQLYLDTEGVYSTPVTYTMTELWEKDEDELFRMAWANQSREGGYVLEPIEKMLFTLFTGSRTDQPEDTDMLFPGESDLHTGLLVLTNRSNCFGAVQLLNDAALQEASEILGGDYWVFPSSVHEVILAPVNLGRSRQELEDMVREINGTQVLEEEVLGEHVYYYEHTSGFLC